MSKTAKLEAVLETLKRGRELVASGFCKGAYFRAEDGLTCDLEKATAFCALGALKRASSSEAGYMLSLTALSEVSKVLYGEYLYQVNDSYGKEAVLRVYDMAIKKAGES